MFIDFACPRCGNPRESYDVKCNRCGLKPYSRAARTEVEAVGNRRAHLQHLARERAVFLAIELLLVGGLALALVWIASEADPVIVGASILLIATIVTFALARNKNRGLRGDKIVVWIRRFRRERSRTVGFAGLLRHATAGVAVPITVQDSTYRLSLEVAITRLFSSYMVESVISTIGLLGLLAWFITMILVPREFTTYVLACAALAMIVGIVLALRRVGYVRISSSVPAQEVAEILEQATTPRYETIAESLTLGRILYQIFFGGLLKILIPAMRIFSRFKETQPSGVLVLKCDDAVWQAVVEKCLSTAAAAVIDLTDLSENVQWEIDRAVEIVGPKSVIFAVPVDEDGKHASDAISRAIDGYSSRGCRTFSFKADLSGGFFTRRRKRRELILNLQKELDHAIAAWIERMRNERGSSPVDRYIAEYKKKPMFASIKG